VSLWWTQIMERIIPTTFCSMIKAYSNPDKYDIWHARNR
jgi:hypothetical protein